MPRFRTTKELRRLQSRAVSYDTAALRRYGLGSPEYNTATTRATRVFRAAQRMILDQADRIIDNPLATQARIDRANIAADRYTDNIMRQRSFKGKNAYERQYSRSTYMGLNAG